MDLNMLRHLSEKALREEAARRGLPTAGLDREQLMLAIRGHEGQLATLPPGRLEAMAFAPTVPPRSRGPAQVARVILAQVMKLARPAPAPEVAAPPPSGEPEPIRTRSMAKLLEGQGHDARALAIVEELARQAPADRELAGWRDAIARRVGERAIRALAAERRARTGSFVEVLASSEGARGIVWRVEPAGILRAQALLGATGALTLRVVRVRAHADHSVESRQEDRRPLEVSGWAFLDAPPAAKLIASVGLAEGERFVSIAHARG